MATMAETTRRVTARADTHRGQHVVAALGRARALLVNGPDYLREAL